MALKMPKRFRLPPELEEAMLLVETGWPPDILGEMPQATIEAVIIYKSVKAVTENGGEYNPE